MIKKLPIQAIVFWLFAASVLPAQTPCSAPNSQIDIYGNNIRARLLNGGDLFWDFNDAQFTPNPSPGIPNPSTIFAAGFWIGGLDPAGNLKLAAVKYRANGSTDYRSGPLNADGTIDNTSCANWDRFFKVKGADIKAFLDDLPNFANNPSAAVAAYPSIMGWPGWGNPYFSTLNGFDLPNTPGGLAPFYDADQNGLYDPLQGDYPAVKLQATPPFVPAEIVWCVFNDQGNGIVHPVTQAWPLQMEVQLTTWAFNCPDDPVLNNTIFTAHRMLYKYTEPMDSCFVGMWVDFDLGCYTDDYFGSNPDLNTFFAYNADALDGTGTGTTCNQGVPTFGDHPPVQSVTFLSRKLDKLVYFVNPSVGSWPTGMTEPIFPYEYYNFLSGTWRDGTPLTYGGLGYNSGSGIPADYAFPADPADPNGWSMCTAGIPAADYRMLGTHKIGKLQPGQVEELVTAWTVHPDPDLPCGLGSTFDEISGVRAQYDAGFANVCSPLTAVDNILAAPVGIFPNPANNAFTVQYGDLPVRAMRLFSADGRYVRSWENVPPAQMNLSIEHFPAGMYTLQLLTDRGSLSRKVSVMR